MAQRLTARLQKEDSQEVYQNHQGGLFLRPVF